MNTLNKRICATLTAISMTLGSTAFSAQSSAHNGDGLSALSTLSALPVASVLVAGAQYVAARRRVDMYRIGAGVSERSFTTNG